MLLRQICIALALAVLMTTGALAFEPEPLNRAYPIVGPDLVSGEIVSLESYRGKWIYLEFWASW